MNIVTLFRERFLGWVEENNFSGKKKIGIDRSLGKLVRQEHSSFAAQDS